MKREGPLTIRHVAVAVAVVVLVNAQLTWWIIYSLRENRTRLGLERERLVAMAELVVAEVELRGRSAALDAGLPGNDRPLDDDLEIVAGEERPSVAGQPPQLALPPPFGGQVVRPRPEVWAELLEGYRGRIVMMVSEGSFFGVMLLVVVGLLWKTVRREVELERQHRNFLSAITHELKSPLASMRLSLETVLRGRADQSASVRFLENALQDTERLQSLVQKVLEVTRYGHSGGTVNLERCCLTAVVEDTLASFGRRATVAGVRVDLDLQPEVWAGVDAEAFAIVLSNLLENGVKYGGPVPALAVRLALEGTDAVLDVSDNGRGIPPEEVPFVFNRFFRGGDEMTRTTQGTGLGLYLVRQIVIAHRGTVEVHRTGGEGTVFRVRLPDAEVWEESR